MRTREQSVEVGPPIVAPAILHSLVRLLQWRKNAVADDEECQYRRHRSSSINVLGRPPDVADARHLDWFSRSAFL